MEKNDVQLTKMNSNSRTALTLEEISPSVFQKKGRTYLEKILLVITFLTVLATIAACIAIAVVVRRDEGDGVDVPGSTEASQQTTTSIPVDNSVCLTPECVVVAARVHASIDYSIHPCDNFFEFACGNWIKKHPIPEDRGSLDSFGVLRDDVEVILKDLLEAPSLEGEVKAITKAKTLYISCLNESAIEHRGLDPLNKLYNLTGRWPLVDPDAWDEDKFDIVEELIIMRHYNLRPLIRLSVSTDLKNSAARILQLDQPSLIMPGRDYYLSKAETAVPALKSYLKGLAIALGATDNVELDKNILDVVNFEIQIANLTIPDEDRRDTNALYNKMSMTELKTNISEKFDWSAFLLGVMNLPGVEVPLANEEPVVVYSPVYLANLIDFLETTSNRTIANYMMAYMMVHRVTALPQNIQDLGTEYNKVIFGTQAARARWRTCASITNAILGHAVGRLFVDAVFDEDAKASADEMIKNLRMAFNVLLTDNDWMDDTTRAVAKDKADAIQEKIGYSEEDIKDDNNLNEKYKNVTYEGDMFFENDLMNDQMQSTEELRKLREPIDKTEWGTDPAVVNAYYSPTRNQIMFPAGILQPPFFHKNYPKSLNYGGIGMVIGHEITHGFDDRGRRFDKEGDLTDWWNPDVIERFKERAGCIVDQYFDYFMKEAGMNLNGNNTQGENIADNGGIKQSYTAFREWVKSQGKEEPLLPGLSFNHKQLFFINFAQIWCGSYRPENAINRILTGVHSPGRFRVIGTLHNSDDFAEVFDCPKTSYMNQEKKCRVW